jgi:hypothetical protein
MTFKDVLDSLDGAGFEVVDGSGRAVEVSLIDDQFLEEWAHVTLRPNLDTEIDDAVLGDLTVSDQVFFVSGDPCRAHELRDLIRAVPAEQ